MAHYFCFDISHNILIFHIGRLFLLFHFFTLLFFMFFTFFNIFNFLRFFTRENTTEDRSEEQDSSGDQTSSTTDRRDNIQDSSRTGDIIDVGNLVESNDESSTPVGALAFVLNGDGVERLLNDDSITALDVHAKDESLDLPSVQVDEAVQLLVSSGDGDGTRSLEGSVGLTWVEDHVDGQTLNLERSLGEGGEGLIRNVAQGNVGDGELGVDELRSVVVADSLISTTASGGGGSGGGGGPVGGEGHGFAVGRIGALGSDFDWDGREVRDALLAEDFNFRTFNEGVDAQTSVSNNETDEEEGEDGVTNKTDVRRRNIFSNSNFLVFLRDNTFST